MIRKPHKLPLLISKHKHCVAATDMYGRLSVFLNPLPTATSCLQTRLFLCDFTLAICQLFFEGDGKLIHFITK